MSSFHHDHAEWNVKLGKSLVPGAPNGTDWNLAHNVADQRPKAYKKWDHIFFKTWWGRCGKDEDDSLGSIS